jgi:hypothetical protein
MKWRSRGDSQNLDSAPEEAVGERLATPPDLGAGAGTAMHLSSVSGGD